ncbi:MAG: recombinase family protein [Acetatifactor muris]|nr:recombinase family protein [Acetatifactor muris]
MGRVSKRKAAGVPARQAESLKRYQAGLYARLSSDQDIEKNESVEVQIEIAKKFVEEFNQRQNGEVIEVAGCYTDLGKTGSNFNRDGFLRLMQDIRLGEINCVIVKDLSRFGRNYLEAGNYIEKIFPFLGVRFIAVADGYDTGEEGGNNRQMTSEIKNLVNDMYAKDFSRKAKVGLKMRREQGSYVGGPPPYGYTAAWEGRRRVLVPDENTAQVVRFIFERFLETESVANVADELNRRRTNPPAVYKKTGAAYYSEEESGYKGWDRSTVERILKSRAYTGTLVQGKTSITAKDEKNRIHKPESEWVVSEDSHEPLVDAGLYRRAQEAMERVRERTVSQGHPSKGYPIGENVFDKVLYCGVCGRKMTRHSYVKHLKDGSAVRMEGYFCMDSIRTKVATCPEPNRISKLALLDILIPLIRTEFAVYLDKPAHYLESGRERIKEVEKKLTTQLHETERQIRRLQEEEGRAYADYCTGKQGQQEYTACKARQKDRLADLEKQKTSLEGKKKEFERTSEKYLAAVRALVRFNPAKALTKEMVEAFFSKIYVYPGKRVEAMFTFTPDSGKGAV